MLERIRTGQRPVVDIRAVSVGETRCDLAWGITENGVPAGYVTDGGRIDDEDPVDVPSNLIFFHEVATAVALEADPEVNVATWRLGRPVAVECAVAKHILVTVDQTNPAAWGPA